MNQEYKKMTLKLEKFRKSLTWINSIMVLTLLSFLLVGFFIPVDNPLHSILSYMLTIILLSSIIILPILSIMSSKLKKEVALEKLNQIFSSKKEDEEDVYTFQMEVDEIEVQLDSTGITIGEQHHMYEDYEITISTIGYRGILYFDLCFTKTDLEKKNEEYTNDDAFCIEMDRRAYQALKQFDLKLDAQSKHTLEMIKKDPKYAVKVLMRRNFSILKFIFLNGYDSRF